MGKITAGIEISKDNKLLQEEQELRKEARRLVSLSNKRLKRLEEQNLINSPAYRKWVEDGEQKFGIRGKSAEEVKQEVARMEHFIKLQTSTITGAKDHLKNLAKSIDITYKDIPDLQDKLSKFFQSVDKVREFLENSKEISVAIGYAKVYDTVSDYVTEYENNLDDLDDLIEEMADKVLESSGMGEVDSLLDDELGRFFN